MEVMHERNAHNFPLDLAAAESTPRGSDRSRHRLRNCYDVLVIAFSPTFGVGCFVVRKIHTKTSRARPIKLLPFGVACSQESSAKT
jgi:hypothetical protein